MKPTARSFHKLLFLLLFTSFAAFGQQMLPPPPPAPPSYQLHQWTDSLKNVKTDDYTLIPATKLYIVLHGNLTIATNNVGLSDSVTKAYINIIGGPGSNYRISSATVSRQSLEQQGMHVTMYKDILFDGYPARIIKASANKATEYMLMFGDSTFAYVIVGVYPSYDENNGFTLESSMKSVYYDKNAVIDLRASAPFTFNDSATLYKYTTGALNSFFFQNVKDSGSLENGYPVQSIITLSISTPNWQPSAAAVSMLTSLEKKGFVVKESKNETNKTISGHDAYEVEIYGTYNNKNCLIYMLVIADKDLAICSLGIAFKDYPQNLAEFKKLAYTVKIKPQKK